MSLAENKEQPWYARLLELGQEQCRRGECPICIAIEKYEKWRKATNWTNSHFIDWQTT